MYSKYKSSILILLVLVVQYSYGERTKLPRFGNKTVLAAGTHIELSAVKCTHTVPEIVEYLQCLLIRRNSSRYITIRLLLHQSVARFDTNAVLDILGPTKNHNTILRSDIDCCALFSGKNHSIYVINHVYKLVYAAINETVTCPLKAVS